MTHPDQGPHWPAVIPALLLVVSLGGVTAIVVRRVRRPGCSRVESINPRPALKLPPAPSRLDDPRLNSLRLAAEHWKTSLESQRVVIDQVCLVTDVAAFLEAIAQWDERHFFPILIDEPALTLPFLRAFRPARVIRYHSSTAQPGVSDELEKLSTCRQVAMKSGLGRSRRWLAPGQTLALPITSFPPPRRAHGTWDRRRRASS